MCEEKHKKTRGTVIWVRERQDRKRWWQHSRKEKVGQNKKKRMKGRKHERGRARRQESSILTKTWNEGKEKEDMGMKQTHWKWPQSHRTGKKNSSEVSANQTDSMTGRWKELNDVSMRAKRNRRWQKDGRGGHRVERVRKEGKWLAGKKTDGGKERETDEGVLHFTTFS